MEEANNAYPSVPEFLVYEENEQPEFISAEGKNAVIKFTPKNIQVYGYKVFGGVQVGKLESFYVTTSKPVKTVTVNVRESLKGQSRPQLSEKIEKTGKLRKWKISTVFYKPSIHYVDITVDGRRLPPIQVKVLGADKIYCTFKTTLNALMKSLIEKQKEKEVFHQTIFDLENQITFLQEREIQIETCRMELKEAVNNKDVLLKSKKHQKIGVFKPIPIQKESSGQQAVNDQELNIDDLDIDMDIQVNPEFFVPVQNENLNINEENDFEQIPEESPNVSPPVEMVDVALDPIDNPVSHFNSQTDPTITNNKVCDFNCQTDPRTTNNPVSHFNSQTDPTITNIKVCDFNCQTDPRTTSPVTKRRGGPGRPLYIIQRRNLENIAQEDARGKKRKADEQIVNERTKSKYSLRTINKVSYTKFL